MNNKDANSAQAWSQVWTVPAETRSGRPVTFEVGLLPTAEGHRVGTSVGRLTDPVRFSPENARLLLSSVQEAVDGAHQHDHA
ncbi:hypothetical protein [Amycolatopsis magusensis]|uniref:hypothetical protein n=1 Tax=Amycolatopsis magusensis TaxID=882444 RepID=UPI00378D4D1A